MQTVVWPLGRSVGAAVLLGTTRWLKAHPYDAVIHEARNYLRAKFPPVR